MKKYLFNKKEVNIRNIFLEYSVWDLGLAHDRVYTALEEKTVACKPANQHFWGEQ